MSHFTKQRAFRVSPAFDDRLVALARREGNPVGAVVRRILAAALDRELDTPPTSTSTSTATSPRRRTRVA